MLREGQEMHVRYMRVAQVLNVSDYPYCGLEDRGVVNDVRILKRRLGTGNETGMLARMHENGHMNLETDTIYYLTEQDAIDGIDRGHAWEQSRKCRQCGKDDLPLNQQSHLCVRCAIDNEQEYKLALREGGYNECFPEHPV